MSTLFVCSLFQLFFVSVLTVPSFAAANLLFFLHLQRTESCPSHHRIRSLTSLPQNSKPTGPEGGAKRSSCTPHENHPGPRLSIMLLCKGGGPETALGKPSIRATFYSYMIMCQDSYHILFFKYLYY